MPGLSARDIMHPNLSVAATSCGEELLSRLLSGCSALPVVNDRMEVVGVVSEADVIRAMGDGKAAPDLSAERIMCRAEEKSCGLVTVTSETPLENVVSLFFSGDRSPHVIPVVEDNHLVGVISRQTLFSSLIEEGLLPDRFAPVALTA